MARTKPQPVSPYSPALIIGSFVVAALGFLYLTYLTSFSEPQMILRRSLFMTRLSVVIPEIIIWALALVCALRFKRYVTSIKHTQDGVALNLLANGLLYLVLYIVLLTIGDTLRNVFNTPANLKVLNALVLHIPLAVLMVSVAYLYQGSQLLRSVAKAPAWSDRKLLAFLLPLILFSVPYMWHFNITAAGLYNDNGLLRFALPITWLLFSYVLPHLVIWLLGLIACYNIAEYSVLVKGPIYKSLFRNLYRGILLVYLCTFFAQLLIISSASLSHFSMTTMLIYGILLLSVVGFVLVYLGTGKLAKIDR